MNSNEATGSPPGGGGEGRGRLFSRMTPTPETLTDLHDALPERRAFRFEGGESEMADPGPSSVSG